MISDSDIWLIEPAWLERAQRAMKLRVNAADFKGREQPISRRSGSTAVIPVLGPISRRPTFFSELFGGTSTEALKRSVTRAAQDPEVATIVLQIDSPGGHASGIQELSDLIFEARRRKLIIGVADSFAASAAFWIGSAATEFVASPSAEIGSVGAVLAHLDISELEKKAGVKTTLITAGDNKSIASPFEPLSSVGREELQRQVDRVGNSFVSALARNRGVTRTEVNQRFGQGLMFGADEARRRGMVDRVATIESVVGSLSRRDDRRQVGAFGGLVPEDMDLRERRHRARRRMLV